MNQISGRFNITLNIRPSVRAVNMNLVNESTTDSGRKKLVARKLHHVRISASAVSELDFVEAPLETVPATEDTIQSPCIHSQGSV
jgi:hypothetical protein